MKKLLHYVSCGASFFLLLSFAFLLLHVPQLFPGKYRQLICDDQLRRDREANIRIISLLAGHGNPVAECTLGFILVADYGNTTAIRASGLSWLRKAALHGNSSAARWLGIFLVNPIERKTWFLLAAQGGDPSAQVFLAEGLTLESKLAYTDRLSRTWLERAAAQNVYAAQILLSKAYQYDGDGLFKDYVKAYFWALIAYKNSESKGSSYQELESHLTAVELANVRRMADKFFPRCEPVSSVPVSYVLEYEFISALYRWGH